MPDEPPVSPTGEAGVTCSQAIYWETEAGCAMITSQGWTLALSIVPFETRKTTCIAAEQAFLYRQVP